MSRGQRQSMPRPSYLAPGVLEHAAAAGEARLTERMSRQASRDLCIMACVFCRDTQFQAWAERQIADLDLVIICASRVARGEQLAKAFILRQCQVTSRNELDTSPDAAQRFHDLVRRPYLEWKEGQL